MSENEIQSPNLDLPDWYPDWACEIAELYFSGSSCFFVIHGNVNDLIPCDGKDGTEFLSLGAFLGDCLLYTSPSPRD